MAKFMIQPHGRLQEWIAHEKGYFRDEGSTTSSSAGLGRHTRRCGRCRQEVSDLLSGAFEFYKQAGATRA